MRTVNPDRLVNVLTVAYVALLSYLTLACDPWWIFGSAGRSVEDTIDSTLADHIQHSVAFGVLGVLLATHGLSANRTRVRLLIAFGLCHAIGTECLQHWIPMRTCMATDVVANVAGLVAGWWMLRILSDRLINLPTA